MFESNVTNLFKDLSTESFKDLSVLVKLSQDMNLIIKKDPFSFESFLNKHKLDKKMMFLDFFYNKEISNYKDFRIDGSKCFLTYKDGKILEKKNVSIDKLIKMLFFVEDKNVLKIMKIYFIDEESFKKIQFYNLLN